MESVTRIIEEKGKAAMELARKQILELNRNQGLISDALAYFATVTLRGGLPVFPALTSISYEVVGGKTDQATRIAAALTCIAAAADIHDDVIDQSTVKYSKKTVLGKYGTEAAILAGDALLIQGVMLLHSECAVLDADKKSAIDSLLLDAFAEISQAEAAEIVLKKKGAVSPNEFFDTMKMKAVVPELHCKVGAILGGGTAAAVDALGQYGRAFGISSAIREEFIDVLDWSELQSRLRNECPPLPVLYALEDSATITRIEQLLKNQKFTRKRADLIAEAALDAKATKKLKSTLNSTIAKGIEALKNLPKSKAHETLKSLIASTKENLGK